MRVIVISDNHGSWDVVQRALKAEKHDFAIHLGDAEASESEVKALFDRYVGGNHDYGFAKYEDVFELDGIKIAITHGHLRGLMSFFGRKNSTIDWAKEIGADLLLHGHAHIPSDDMSLPLRTICPGSITQPRSPIGSTYLVFEIKNGKIQNVEFKHPV